MTDTDRARQNAANWAETIAEMIRALAASPLDGDDTSAEDAIQEAPLTVEVRSGWYSFGAEPELIEYQIMLSYGGPSLRITGRLGEYNEPETADLEYQDWGTPWTRYHPAHGEPLFNSHNADVLTFAQQFYFGE